MSISVADILFHIFALISILGALSVILSQNPVYSAFFLALTMCILGALFFTLGAPFIAAAQIIVYAGAVMVLFTMVVMLFNLKGEGEKILPFRPFTIIKVVSGLLLLTVLSGSTWLAVSNPPPDEKEFGSTVRVAELLFTSHVFSFEAVSLLLLVAIVGAVALARSKGGTHAR